MKNKNNLNFIIYYKKFKLLETKLPESLMISAMTEGKKRE